jgi:hypothetical protein
MSDIKPDWSGARGRVRVIESDYLPVCPHCRKPLEKVMKFLSQGGTQSEAIYSCGECGELIGIGYGRS